MDYRMKLPKCQYCDRQAAWLRPWDKTKLCVMHFNKSFHKKVQKTINKYKMLERDDIIAVGLSGGKDSVVMMDIMTSLQKNHTTELIAISIDEGIENYRADGLKYAKLAAERAGVEHHVFSYKEAFGYDLDEALIILGENRLSPCSYCGPFRRKLLNEAARDVGATKLVTGHNADDEAQTLLMNVMRGDLLKTLHSNPVPTFKNKSFVNRVKPFRRTSEQEIVIYANFNELPYQEMSCPHATEAYRGKIRNILSEMMVDDPGVVFSILNSADSLHDLAAKIPDGTIHGGNKPILECMKCGEPTNNEYCNACRLQGEIDSANYSN